MSAFEYLEIALALREEAQQQFEYWLTISFAYIAATFFGKELLTAKTSWVLAGLYVLAVSLLVTRYAVSGMAVNRYVELAVQNGAPPIGDSDLITYLRIAVFVVGTLTVLWFLYLHSRK